MVPGTSAPSSIFIIQQVRPLRQYLCTRYPNSCSCSAAEKRDGHSLRNVRLKTIFKRNLQAQFLGYEIVHTGQGVVQLGHIYTAALVVAKSALLRFRLTAKTAPAPLLLLPQGGPLRWARLGFPEMSGLPPAPNSGNRCLGNPAIFKCSGGVNPPFSPTAKTLVQAADCAPQLRPA